MKKIFLVYGHYNDNSFNAAIRDEFVKQSKVNGNQVDVVDLYKEKFDPVFFGQEPDNVVLDHRKRIEKSDVIVLIARVIVLIAQVRTIILVVVIVVSLIDILSARLRKALV